MASRRGELDPKGGQVGETATQSARPFYFMVPFWGERYRNYFLDFCLASMLAPNNLGLLRAADGHRFLIATTRADWQAIERSPLMEKLRAHATPTLVEIDNPKEEAAPGGVAAITKQNAGQRKLIEIAFRDRVYGSLLLPDIIVSDGMVAALLCSVKAGHRLVLCGALRQTQETVLAELDTLGYLPADARPALTGKPVTIPPRIVADLAVRHLHWEVTVFDAGDTKAPYLAPFLFWRMPGHRGIILHTSHGVNVFMDYSAIDNHDLDCLDTATLEDVYVGRNFARCGGIYVVQDSDEFGVLSLTPAAVGQRHVPLQRAGHGWFQKTTWCCDFRKAMAWHVGRARDAVRRQLFCTCIRIHVGDLDKVWKQEERRIEVLVDRAVGDYRNDGGRPSDFPSFPNLNPRYLPLDLILWYRANVRPYSIFIGKALAGDRREWARIGRRIGKIMIGCRNGAARLLRQ